MRHRIKLTNKTAWNTRELKRIFLAVLRTTDKVEGRFPHNPLHIKVDYSRRWWSYTGHAWQHSGHMRLRVPRHGEPEMPVLNPFKLAWLFHHELDHCRGYDHKQMGATNNWITATQQHYPYVVGMEIKPSAKKPQKAKPSIQVRRYKRALELLAKKRARLKRLQNTIKKLQARCKYYERQGIAETPIM